MASEDNTAKGRLLSLRGAEGEGRITPRILVVDDEKRIRDACHKMLTQEGCEVERAETGDSGLRMLEDRHYDIVLLDLMMPGLPGLEALERVRTLHPDTVVIVITGYATLEHSIEAMKKGAFDFIPKPFSPQDLRLVVTKALEHLRSLEDIAHERSRTKTLIDQLADGVLATDAEKRVALANPLFLKMAGVRQTSIVGKPVTEVVEDETLNDMIDQALAMPMKEYAVLTDELSRGEPGTEEEQILRIRCVPFRDRMGRTVGSLTLLQDITALKKLDRIRSEFVSMVAHEIRGPMNSALALVDVLLKGRAGSLTEKQEDLLGRAHRKIRSLAELTSGLLDLSRVESGLLVQEKETFPISDLLEEQVKFHKQEAESEEIEIEVDADPGLPPLLANRSAVEEVVSNLLTNAVKYTPPGGKVILKATKENDYFCLSVTDTGIGIPEGEQKRIFEKFYRVKTDETRKIPGTGLGLSIVKSIVEEHNGMIGVDSSPGSGTTFRVYFPVSQA